jgi:hypothetical protein
MSSLICYASAEFRALAVLRNEKKGESMINGIVKEIKALPTPPQCKIA